MPDVLTCINGIFTGLELKSDAGKPSQLQLENLREIRKSSGLGFVLYPKCEKYLYIFLDLMTHQDYIDELKSNIRLIGDYDFKDFVKITLEEYLFNNKIKNTMHIATDIFTNELINKYGKDALMYAQVYYSDLEEGRYD